MGPGKWRCVGFLLLCTLASVHAQGPSPEEKIPIERCDLLPVVLVRIEGTNMRFLLDTAATTMLNIKSFSKGRSKKIQVSSWSGTAATSAREVFLPQLSLGGHRLENLKLPAIDLSPIGKACGGQIDGIFGIVSFAKTLVGSDFNNLHRGEGPPIYYKSDPCSAC